MASFTDLPGYLGFTSKGVIAIHANWPAYPEEHGWQLPLLWFSIFPTGTRFNPIDDIDRCVLFLADLKCNKSDKFDESNFHVAVWHEDLLALQSQGYIRGVKSTCHRARETAFRKKLFELGKLYYEVEGEMKELILPPIKDYDCPDRDWPAFPNNSISLTAKGRLAAARVLVEIPRRELKGLGNRVRAALEAQWFDTAVREACVALETELKAEVGGPLYGDRLVEAFAKKIKDSKLFRETFLKTFRIELRAVFKFLRNDFMHNLRKLDEKRCIAILFRVAKVRNSFAAIRDGLNETSRKRTSS